LLFYHLTLKKVLFYGLFCNSEIPGLGCRQIFGLSLWLIGTVRAEPETVVSRAWVQSPDPAE